MSPSSAAAPSLSWRPPCWQRRATRRPYRQQQAKRLTYLARSDAGRADALEESLVLVLTRLQPQATRFSFSNHELTSRRSQAVEIDDEQALAPEWLTVKTTTQPDKAAIKEALKAGQQIPGAQLLSRRTWRITWAGGRPTPIPSHLHRSHGAHLVQQQPHLRRQPDHATTQGPYLVHPPGQLGGAHHPQTRPSPDHIHCSEPPSLGADRTAAENLRPLIPLPGPTYPLNAMTCTFSTEQIQSLSAPLDRGKVKQREQGRAKVSYLEGWQVIAEANRIFGFDGLQRETVALRCVSQAERRIGREPSKPSDPPQRDGWGVTYTARVRVIVGGIVREGCGAGHGHGIDVDLGQAHESALKEAETDAMKRALMTFGNPFGLALYDKQQREVTRSVGEITDKSPASNGTRSIHRSPSPLAQNAAAEAGDDPSLIPLDPATTRQILATLRGLPRPVLEGYRFAEDFVFTKAFRKRFQVPEEATSIADRILQKRHHDWIEAYLVQRQTVA
jgi:hypothetical protein